ncbi:hypothetical protein T4D_7098 [Trichinella pseudospiralis]|uniref:DDE-1 domain-containing protein n=1 Tax=Trichinella pseudospiralis TaxID=6337 RepID=A0A0V1FC52_TRIPS|nr:hypothetical protein T4D_7098 [Trichinella pseudospiralis]
MSSYRFLAHVFQTDAITNLTRKSGCNLCELEPSIGPSIIDMTLNMGTFTWRVACAVGPQHLRGICVPVIPRMLNVGSPEVYGLPGASLLRSTVIENKRLSRDSRKSALIADNCPAHPDVSDLKCRKRIFYYQIQRVPPCDQGIIQNAFLQRVELFSIGNESESEDADADSQNIKIPSSSEVSGYVRAITSLCRVPERQRVNVQLYRQIGRFHC